MAALDFPTATTDGQIFKADNGVWYTWVAAGSYWSGSLGTAIGNLEGYYVNKTGDKMFGNLTLGTEDTTSIVLNATSGAATFDGRLTLNGTGAGTAAYIGNNGEVQITYDGSITAAGKVEFGTTSKATFFTNGEVQLAGNNVNFQPDGSASFAGNVQSGGNPQSGANEGSQLFSNGSINATRTRADFPVWTGYNTGNSTATSQILADGSASFAGKVDIGDFGVGNAENKGICIYETGAMYGQVPGSVSDNSQMLRFYKGQDLNVWIDAGGSAEFGNGKIYLNKSGSATFAGDVGIGTSPPSATLHLKGTGVATNAELRIDDPASTGNTTSAIRFQRNSADYAYIGGAAFSVGNGSVTDLGLTSKNNILFASGGGNERMRIDSSGRLLVGTTSARDKFFSSLTLPVQVEGSSTDKCSLAITRNDNTGDSAKLVLAHARGTEYQILQNNDAIGDISWQAADGAKFGQAANIRAFVDGTPSLNNTPGYIAFGTTSFGANNPVERMRIQSSGKVGIGTPSPIGLLDIQTSSNRKLVVQFDIQTQLKSANNSDNPENLQIVGDEIKFKTGTTGNGTERMRIERGGGVLIGCTVRPNPGASNSNDGFAINGSGSSSYFTSQITDGPCGYFRRDGSNGGVLYFYRGATAVGTISVTGSATSYNESSDYRLKENIVDITDGISRLKQLQPRRFNFIVDAETTVDGFIAHEAQTVVPEAVTGTKDEVDDDGNAVIQGIDKSKLVPLLTAALQETIAKIETLEQRLSDAGL